MGSQLYTATLNFSRHYPTHSAHGLFPQMRRCLTWTVSCCVSHAWNILLLLLLRYISGLKPTWLWFTAEKIPEADLGSCIGGVGVRSCVGFNGVWQRSEHEGFNIRSSVSFTSWWLQFWHDLSFILKHLIISTTFIVSLLLVFIY